MDWFDQVLSQLRCRTLLKPETEIELLLLISVL